MVKILTIDGTAGSGKGTLAKALAEKLNFAHLDTGLLYRRVALSLNDQNLDPTADNAIKTASQITLPIEPHPKLKTPPISSIASKIATFKELRQILLPIQQRFAHHPPSPFQGVVLDGRDTGSVVCPDAQAKFYLEASLSVRAKRRYLELAKSTPLKQLEQAIAERDNQDKNRLHAPLIVPKDAKIIDTSHLSLAKTLEICLAWLQSLGMIHL